MVKEAFQSLNPEAAGVSLQDHEALWEFSVDNRLGIFRALHTLRDRYERESILIPEALYGATGEARSTFLVGTNGRDRNTVERELREYFQKEGLGEVIPYSRTTLDIFRDHGDTIRQRWKQYKSPARANRQNQDALVTEAITQAKDFLDQSEYLKAIGSALGNIYTQDSLRVVLPKILRELFTPEELDQMGYDKSIWKVLDVNNAQVRIFVQEVENRRAEERTFLDIADWALHHSFDLSLGEVAAAARVHYQAALNPSAQLQGISADELAKQYIIRGLLIAMGRDQQVNTQHVNETIRKEMSIAYVRGQIHMLLHEDTAIVSNFTNENGKKEVGVFSLNMADKNPIQKERNIEHILEQYVKYLRASLPDADLRKLPDVKNDIYRTRTEAIELTFIQGKNMRKGLRFRPTSIEDSKYSQLVHLLARSLQDQYTQHGVNPLSDEQAREQIRRIFLEEAA